MHVYIYVYAHMYSHEYGHLFQSLSFWSICREQDVSVGSNEPISSPRCSVNLIPTSRTLNIPPDQDRNPIPAGPTKRLKALGF